MRSGKYLAFSLCIAGLLGIAATPLAALGADVYVTHAADGTPTYATQPQDASYVLMLKGQGEQVRGTAAPVGENSQMRKRRESLEPLILQAAAKHGLDAALVRAIAHVESRFNSGAVSPAGAAGVMQLMPATAKRYGVVLRSDPAQNLDAGARYFKDLLTLYSGNVALALAAYNSGEGNVARHANKVPPFRETMLYVPEVLTRYESYRQADASALGQQ